MWYLKDTNRDGLIRATERRQVAQNMKLAHGLDVRDGKLYVVGEKTIWVMDIARDGGLSVPRVFADGFPDAGQHPARSLKWGPDGYLYASFGSTNNDAPTPNPEEATMLRISPDGKTREIFARGLRHTIGFGWHPVSGVLYGADQGSDWHGDNIPRGDQCHSAREELRLALLLRRQAARPVRERGQHPGKITKAEYCAGTQGSVLNYTAHAAAIAMTYYTGTQFPAEYRNDAFIAYRGSWNRTEPSGYEIARVVFGTQNTPSGSSRS